MAVGLTLVYVGWSLYRERGVPDRFGNGRVLGMLFTQQWLPPEMRVREWFDGGIRVVLGTAFVIGGVIAMVSSVASALR